MAASTLSPSSSPRLPSPPPIAEDQLGPKSPIASTEEQQKLWLSVDHGAARRIRPGTKAADMAEGPPLVDLSEIDSAFQLTEHLKALHNFLTHAPGSETTQPIDRETAHKLAQPPDNVDKTLWLYELCRFLTQKVNSIIVALFFDTPACSATTCPEMRASEWQYLCAVHDPPKSCCAIDYCCHTLDWAANTLTSPKTFPSRLSLGTEPNTQHQQIRQLTNIFRRVYRIFAHAWFQHREMFWKVETRTGLYVLFKTVCDVYGLIPEDNYTIPSEAEGIELSADSSGANAQATTAPVILKREASDPGSQDQESGSIIEGISEHSLSTAGTTKRHRHSPSVGATAVSTVVEEAEEEEQALPELELHAQTQAQDALPETQPAGDVTSDPADENADAEAETEPSDSTVLSQPITSDKQDDSSATITQDPASPPAPEPLPAPAPAAEEKETIVTDEAESVEPTEAKDSAKAEPKDEENEADVVANADADADAELESYSFDDATVISAHDAEGAAAEEKEEKEKPEEKAVAEEAEPEAGEASPAEPEKAEKAEKEDEAEEVSAVKEKQSGEEAKEAGV